MKKILIITYILFIISLILGFLGMNGQFDIFFNSFLASDWIILIIYAGIPLMTCLLFIYLLRFKKRGGLHILCLTISFLIFFTNTLSILIGIASTNIHA
ncbi:amino acid ABC transporter [Listeria sp. PSOL-1]|uniref:amino acid ABC transporter n=1 Tax=Listeria sp. PSOL-1 TaxID=1844999 RepID=UPI0013D83486|nr:amino acid ABC transporter [Listeria sp. PSOL-1]